MEAFSSSFCTLDTRPCFCISAAASSGAGRATFSIHCLTFAFWAAKPASPCCFFVSFCSKTDFSWSFQSAIAHLLLDLYACLLHQVYKKTASSTYLALLTKMRSARGKEVSRVLL